MKMTLKTLIPLAASWTLAVTLSADLAEENFDGYGAVEASLEGLAGGSGFVDGFTSGDEGEAYPLYQAGANLIFGNASSGYVDRGGAGAEDGHILGTATGAFNTHRLIRQVRESALTEGTVWASFITAFDAEATDSRIFFSLSPDGGASPRFGGQGADLLGRIANSNTAADGLADRTRTYLVIARLDIVAEATDQIKVWAFPADGEYEPFTEENLDTQATAMVSDEAEVTGFQYMGIVVGDLTRVDQLRISHGETLETGFQEVLTGESAPEGPKLAMDNFDDYGEAQSALTGIEAGLNFTGPWEEVVEGPDFNQYIPGANLDFANPGSGYTDLNGTDADDGHLLGFATGGFNGHRIVRRVTESVIDDGVIWASFITAFDAEATGARNFFSLSFDGGTSPRFGGQGTDLLARISNSITASEAYDLTETYLVVARLELEAEGDDTLTTWIFPSGGTYEALQPANLDAQAAAMATDTGEATGFKYMGIVSGAGVRVDQIRIAMNTTSDAAFRAIMTGEQPSVLGPPETPYVNYEIGGSTYLETFDGLPNGPHGEAVTWVDGESVQGFYRDTGVRDWYWISDGRNGVNPLLVHGQVEDHPDAGDKSLGLRNHPGTEAETIYVGVLIYNDTLSELTGFNVVYDGEQWYGNSTTSALVPEYSLNATSLTDPSAIWVEMTDAIFNAPHNELGAATQFDGNAPGNRADDLSAIVSDISWPAGGRLWIRWGLAGPDGSTSALSVEDFRFVGFAAGDPPSVPEGLTAQIAFSTAVDLSWTDTSDNETGFEIARRVAGETNFSVAGTVGPNITEFRDTGLDPVTDYEYTVRAVNFSGPSGDAGVVAITTPEARSFVPEAPTGLSVSDVTASTATLAWTDNADDEFGYRVYVEAGDAGEADMIAELEPDSAAYIIPNLTLVPATVYDVWVVAFNEDGESDPAGPVAIETLPADVRYARLQAGWIDVTQPPYNVDPTGVEDAWPVIQGILDVNPGPGGGGGRVLYFPNGEYRFSDALIGPTETNANGKMRIVGESREGTILRLQDNADGYTGLRGSSKPFIAFYEGSASNNAFMNELSNLTVEIGAQNPGAIAVQFHSNNVGAIRDVTIRSLGSNGEGLTGLRMVIPPNGMSYIKDVRIEGFDTGIETGHFHAALVFEHIELVGQNVVGILNTEKPISIRDLHSVNTVPAVIQESAGGQVVLIDSLLEGGDAAASAIENSEGGFLFVRNVRAEGYGQVIMDQHSGRIHYGDLFEGYQFIKEFSSHEPVLESAASASASLALPVRETPEVETGTPDEWLIIEPTGGDDTENIQAALDSGAEVVAFQTGNYTVSATLEVGENVKAVLGNWARLSFGNDLRYAFEPVFRFSNSLHDTVLIEKFDTPYGDHDCHFIQNDLVDTTLVWKDSHIVMGRAYRNSGSGRVFIENVHALSGNHIIELEDAAFQFNGQEVYARQINPEDFIPQMEIVGGSLWVLGFKTGESRGIAYQATDGAVVEVLGGVVNRSVGTSFVPEDMPMLVDHDSSMSIHLVERASRDDDPNEPAGEQRFRHTLVVDSLVGETATEFMWTDFPLRGGPTFGVAIPHYAGYERSAFPLWYQAYEVGSGSGMTSLYVPWFGYIDTYDDSNWLYHRAFGFMYTASETVDALSLYHPALGWLVTGFQYFPAVYSMGAEQWFYLAVSYETPFVYDYVTGEWIPADEL